MFKLFSKKTEILEETAQNEESTTKSAEELYVDAFKQELSDKGCYHPEDGYYYCSIQYSGEEEKKYYQIKINYSPFSSTASFDGVCIMHKTKGSYKGLDSLYRPGIQFNKGKDKLERITKEEYDALSEQEIARIC